MRMTTILTGAALPLALLAGCGKTSDDPGRTEVANYTPPTVRPPTPLPGQAQTTPLAAYVGRYPHDAVGGVDFLDRTEVANGLINAVGDEKVRGLIRGRSGPETPIFAMGPRLASWGCEQHNCGDHNWTLIVDPKNGRSEVCYHDADAMGDRSRWYAGDAPVTKPGVCPSEA